MDNQIVEQNEGQENLPSNKPNLLVIALVFLTFLLVVLLASIASYMFGASNKVDQKPNPEIPTPLPTVIEDVEEPARTFEPFIDEDETPSPIPTSIGNPNLKTFTSQSLKVSFDYLEVIPAYPDLKVKVETAGNKIYVYTGTKAEEGQSAEVFKKDKNDTLEQAIRKQFLNGISEKDCFIEDLTSNYKYPAGYKVVDIGFPYDKNSDIPMFAQENKCPQGYTRSNGIAYFLGDSNHPEIYLYLSIGQYGINADNNKMWQDTIRFL